MGTQKSKLNQLGMKSREFLISLYKSLHVIHLFSSMLERREKLKARLASMSCGCYNKGSPQEAAKNLGEDSNLNVILVHPQSRDFEEMALKDDSKLIGIQRAVERIMFDEVIREILGMEVRKCQAVHYEDAYEQVVRQAIPKIKKAVEKHLSFKYIFDTNCEKLGLHDCVSFTQKLITILDERASRGIEIIPGGQLGINFLMQLQRALVNRVDCIQLGPTILSDLLSHQVNALASNLAQHMSTEAFRKFRLEDLTAFEIPSNTAKYFAGEARARHENSEEKDKSGRGKATVGVMKKNHPDGASTSTD